MGDVTWQERFDEWQALFYYCRENEAELMAKDRMKALVLCLQRHWQDIMRLKIKGVSDAISN